MKEYVLVDFDLTLTSSDTSKFIILEILKKKPLRFFKSIFYLLNLLKAENDFLFQNIKNDFLTFLFKGLDQTEMTSVAYSYSKKVKSLLRHGIIDNLNKHTKKGAQILIVSASPEFLVKESVLHLGYSVIGTKFYQRYGKFSGLINPNICYGYGKVKAIKIWLKNKPNIKFIEAWSDSESDFPMMNLADKRIWVCYKYDRKRFIKLDSRANFYFI
jgi:phosphatidylglycerophosphatase C